MTRNRDSIYLYVILFVVGNLIDIVLTYVAINNFGAIELNLIAGQLMKSVGIVPVMAGKIGLMAIWISVCLFIGTAGESFAWASRKAIVVATALLWLVQAWNMLNIALAI